MFQIKILDARISPEDTIAIGFGREPSFVSVVYAINTNYKTPVRSNYPMSLYIPPSIHGSYMWVVFGAPENKRANLHQFSTINYGFLFEILVVEDNGE